MNFRLDSDPVTGVWLVRFGVRASVWFDCWGMITGHVCSVREDRQFRATALRLLREAAVTARMEAVPRGRFGRAGSEVRRRFLARVVELAVEREAKL
ncbi:hypothetical protein [Marinovum algicola]|uniref:hypothetical protein n=1 Tax=Marinovum algicola TaxID=42444 RepID=UPI003B5252CA